MKVYTDDQVQKKVKAFVKAHGSGVDAAKAAGCTESQVSMAVRGNPPCEKLLNAIGLQRVRVYTEA